MNETAPKVSQRRMCLDPGDSAQGINPVAYTLVVRFQPPMPLKKTLHVRDVENGCTVRWTEYEPGTLVRRVEVADFGGGLTTARVSIQSENGTWLLETAWAVTAPDDAGSVDTAAYVADALGLNVKSFRPR